MFHDPVATVNALIRLHNILEPQKLIPALMRCDPAKITGNQNPVVRFLEFVIESKCFN